MPPLGLPLALLPPLPPASVPDGALLDAPLAIVAVLAINVVVSELLARHTPLRHLGVALLVIVVTAVAANVGLIPPFSDAIDVYAGTFEYVGPLAIFWLLLRVNLLDVLRAGAPMIVLFLLGALGTAAGVIVAMHLVDGPTRIGPLSYALGGMFVGTYTGGSANFNAIAIELGVNRDATLYASATVVDSLMTTIWMSATLILPRILRRLLPGRTGPAAGAGSAEVITGVEDDTETVHPIDLAVLAAAGAAAVWLSQEAKARLGWNSMIVLTTIALALAQIPWVARMRGSRLIGMFAVYLFLAVIGALCDVHALLGSGALGVTLLVFVTLVVGIHGLVTFGGAALLGIAPEVAAVASQANIGGGTTALALARSLGRADLVLPAILVGSLGTALGTYLGFEVAGLLAP